MAWGSLGDLRGSLSELGDSHNSVLAALEDTSVGGVMSGDELNQSGGSSGMGLLDTAKRHGIRDSVEGVVEVLIEGTLEVLADKESLGGPVLNDSLPDELLLAVSAHGLVLSSVEVLKVLHVGAFLVLLLRGVVAVTTIPLGLGSEGGGHEGSRNIGLHTQLNKSLSQLILY